MVFPQDGEDLCGCDLTVRAFPMAEERNGFRDTRKTMSGTLIRVLNKVRRVVFKADRSVEDGPTLAPDCKGQAAGDLIRDKLLADEPCMIARFGNTELRTVLRRWNRTRSGLVLNACRYALGKQGPFWWDDEIRLEIRNLSGFFPCTDDALNKFSDLLLHDARQIDALAVWAPGETALAGLFPHARLIPLLDLEPFHQRDPWTAALEGRTVLVVHPFEDSIREQYAKREVLFADPRMLPDFTLKTIKAVQSLGGKASGFTTWFDALDSMCERIQKTDFDVALIGAGAYGMPLAAFVKRIGKKAVHLGGASQLFFGIRGRRWDDRPFYQKLYNEHWTRPLEEEMPQTYQTVEEGCYW
jgi:hypothetical protein